jgi:uncharacterized protein DUF3306
MARDDGERFLSRWSRLKKEVPQTERQTAMRAPEPKAPPAPPVASASVPRKESPAAPSAVEPQLPSIDTLKGLASEYTEFLKPGVDESLRRSALKKLFSDPYFETFERFEAYCEDYTQGEPIPAAMLKTLEHAKGLLFDEKKKEEEGEVAAGGNLESEAPAQAEAKVEVPVAPPEAKT